MIKLALIGRDISHSKSKDVYEEILDQKIHYTLLDFKSIYEIPNLSDLLRLYDGLSVTSPYKKQILKWVDIDESKRGIVNAIKMEGDKIIATNTDALALEELLMNMLRSSVFDYYIAILGDGNMSDVLSSILTQFKIKHKIFSRKKENLCQTDLVEYFNDFEQYNLRMIINTCSRDYHFDVSSKYFDVFWDLNYNQKNQEKEIRAKNIEYIDGMSLLISQAKYAIKFWNL